MRLVPCATEDAIEVAGDCVDALIDEGWANNQIAFLTTKNRHDVHKGFENNLSEYWKAFHDDDEFYGHVLGFKGLERSVFILCLNGFKDMSRAGELLYVGLSRAVACWWSSEIRTSLPKPADRSWSVPWIGCRSGIRSPQALPARSDPPRHSRESPRAPSDRRRTL